MTIEIFIRYGMALPVIILLNALAIGATIAILKEAWRQ